MVLYNYLVSFLPRKNSTYSIALCPCHTHNKNIEPLPSLVTGRTARIISTALKQLFFWHVLLVHTQGPACSVPSPPLTYLMKQCYSPVIRALHIDMSSVQPVNNHQQHLTIREHHYEQKQCMFHYFLFIYHVTAGLFNKFQWSAGEKKTVGFFCLLNTFNILNICKNREVFCDVFWTGLWY